MTNTDWTVLFAIQTAAVVWLAWNAYQWRLIARRWSELHDSVVESYQKLHDAVQEYKEQEDKRK